MVERSGHLMDEPNSANIFCSKPFVQTGKIVRIYTRIARKKRYWLQRTWTEKKNYSLNVKNLQFKYLKLHKWQSLSTETYFSTSGTCFVIEKILNTCFQKLKAYSKTKNLSKISTCVAKLFSKQREWTNFK